MSNHHSNISSLVRDNNETYKDKIKLEIHFRAYLLTKVMTKPTVHDLLESMKLNREMVIHYLGQLSRDNEFTLKCESELHKNVKNTYISFSARCERRVLNSISSSLIKQRHKA